MKIILILLSLCSFAKAQAVLLTTDFWAVNSPSQVNLKLTTTNNKLEKICGDFEDYIQQVKSSDLYTKDDLILDRSQTEEMASEFEVQFKIDKKTSSDLILKDISIFNRIQQPKSVLPFYNQTLSQLNVLAGPAQNLKIIYNANSLLSFSEKKGLAPLNLLSAINAMESSFKVKGKDAVCDIYRGRARIEFNSRAVAKITLDVQLKIAEFYDKVSEISDNVLKMKKSKIISAAHLGFQLYSVISLYESEEDKQLILLDTLFENFFDAEMQPNAKWEKSADKLYLNVKGAVDVNLLTKLSMEAL